MRYYRGAVPVFPPPPSVTVVVDGRPLPAYVRAFVERGRVFAGVRPLLIALADRAWYEGNVLVLQRDDRRVRVAIPLGSPEEDDVTYLPVAHLLRALGDRVVYSEHPRTIEISTPQASPVALPSPYSALAPSVRPNPVFTPEPVATPRPQWSGSPLPRRTPLPFASPLGKGRR
jgi:hypothetical protein